MATKCEMDKRGVLLFPKVVNGHTHAEYVSSRSCINLTLNQGTQVIDLCGRVSPIGQPVNSEDFSYRGPGRVCQHYDIQV